MSTRSRLTLVVAGGAAAGVIARRVTRRPGVDTGDLSGRTAVVTGAGSGIGRSLALLLAQRGAHVHVVDLGGPAAKTVAAQIEVAGGTALAHEVDVSDAKAVGALADAVFAAGPVDLLFNNAGIGHGGAVVDTTLEDWRRLLDVNVMGVVHGVHAFLPRMLTQGTPAHIMCTASAAGLVSNPGMTPYSTTKAAVVGLCEALDAELHGTSVSVSALCPGVISTGIIATTTLRGEWAQRRESTMSLYEKRGTSPDVVARQALAAITRGRKVVPTPRYQTVPPWMLKRVLPPVGRGLTRLSMKALAKA